MSPVPKEDREKPIDNHPDNNTIDNDDNLPDHVIAISSSDSENEADDGGEYAGYELLPQDPDTLGPPPALDISDGPEQLPQPINIPPNISIPDPPIEDPASLLWNEPPPPESASNNLDETQQEMVKDAMKNIQLPTSNIPEWALNIPEDKWKEHLLTKLHQLENKDNTEKSTATNK
ncbi:uncharacterized protein LOC115222646 [Argonauta hians]